MLINFSVNSLDHLFIFEVNQYFLIKSKNKFTEKSILWDCQCHLNITQKIKKATYFCLFKKKVSEKLESWKLIFYSEFMVTSFSFKNFILSSNESDIYNHDINIFLIYSFKWSSIRKLIFSRLRIL